VLNATPHYKQSSRDYTISQDGVDLIEILMPAFRERAEVKYGEQTYTICRESIMKGTFVLQSGDEALARAQKIDSTAFEIDFAKRRFELRRLSVFQRQMGLLESGAQIGYISTTSWLGLEAVIGLPGDIPIPVQVFIFWLATFQWRRDSAAV
jgi:hypothetical protein